MSLFASLKKFDIYRDVPRDLTEQTLTGAVVSLFCGILVVYLFFSEFLAFLTVDTVSEMYVDPDSQSTPARTRRGKDEREVNQRRCRWRRRCSRAPCSSPSSLLLVPFSAVDHHNHATISIRMNFTVPAMPCAVTSVDVQDVMGSHVSWEQGNSCTHALALAAPHPRACSSLLSLLF